MFVYEGKASENKDFFKDSLKNERERGVESGVSKFTLHYMGNN